MPRLRLIALEPDDLQVLAAYLQDAVAKTSDMTYRPREQRFIALLNRFAWEKSPEIEKSTPTQERRRAALRIERVIKAQVSGLDLRNTSTVASLLTATFEPDIDPAKAPAGTVTLLFSGGGGIRLEVECLELLLEDLGPAWKAKARPRHPAESTE